MLKFYFNSKDCSIKPESQTSNNEMKEEEKIIEFNCVSYSSEVERIGINCLSTELLFQIFSYLDFRELCSISRVCKFWQATANHNICWSLLCEKEGWKSKTSNSVKRVSTSSKVALNWKSTFKNKYSMKLSLEENKKKLNSNKRDFSQLRSNGTSSSITENKTIKAQSSPNLSPQIKASKEASNLKKVSNNLNGNLNSNGTETSHVKDEKAEEPKPKKRKITKAKSTSKLSKSSVKPSVDSESIRTTIQSKFLETLQKNQTENEDCKSLSEEIEKELYKIYGMQFGKYKCESLALRKNLDRYPKIRDLIVKRIIPVSELCKMRPIDFRNYG